MSHGTVSPADSADHDAGLLRRARAGDSAAFDALCDRYAAELFGLALYLTGQSSDAEDVLQETFLAAYEGLGAFEFRSAVKTWLVRILYRRAARHHRSRSVRDRAQPLRLSDASRAVLEGAAAPGTVDAAAVRMDVLEVLERLKPEHRDVLVLRELQGLSYQELAAVLELPDGTVESRLFRARQELKERLKDYAGS